MKKTIQSFVLSVSVFGSRSRFTTASGAINPLLSLGVSIPMATIHLGNAKIEYKASERFSQQEGTSTTIKAG